MSASSPNPRGVVLRRFFGALNLTLFLISVLVIFGALNFLSIRYSRQFDATKTRAYSLSEQTVRLLDNLEGQWTIALLIAERNTPTAVRRQIDEVLKRFSETAPDLSVRRIDPTDPGSMADYDTLMLRLHSIYAELIDEYDIALDEGEAAFNELQLFAQQQAGQLQNLCSRLPEAEVKAHQLQTRAMYMNVMANEADKALAIIHQYRQISDVQPIADYEGARSVLYSALRKWSNILDDLVLIFEQLQELADLDMDVRGYLTGARTPFESLSQRLAIAADPLGRLEPLELSHIGRQIQEGECAIVIGPDGAMSIRSAQLLPKINLRSSADAAVTFDQRFRGEQLIASTIRSMMRDQMPKIVFVHADDQGLFMANKSQIDLVGAKNILSSARFEVQEWLVSSITERPTGKDGQPMVWVIVPPTTRQSLEPSEGELKLIETAKILISEGEPVALNLNPSLLVRFGQPDPWQDVVSLLGLKVDSARAIFEQVRVGGGEVLIERGQTVHDAASDHAVSKAVQGLPMYFGLPMPIEISGSPDSSVRYDIIAQVEPSENRWLEKDWHTGGDGIDAPTPEERFDHALTIAMAIERPHPIERTNQRCLVVSSGGWMLSYLADRVYFIGGDRVALEYPGNYELLLASLAWLAGEDELIAPSPISQEVARLRGITPDDRRRWFWLTIAVLPGACLGLGLFTWLLRRY